MLRVHIIRSDANKITEHRDIQQELSYIYVNRRRSHFSKILKELLNGRLVFLCDSSSSDFQ
jgi:hypothetical protein